MKIDFIIILHQYYSVVGLDMSQLAVEHPSFKI